MPELPELEALSRGLTAATAGRTVTGVAVWQPHALRTVDPPFESLDGATVRAIWRRGKLLGIDFGEVVVVIHLMQAGRLALAKTSAKRPGRAAALAIRLDDGNELRLREAATEHRASVHLLPRANVDGHAPLASLGPEPIGLPPVTWKERLASPAAQLQNAIRDGRRVAGIGRAYASDILWAGRLAPFARTDRLDDDAWTRLAVAADLVLGQAIERACATITTDLPTREGRLTMVHNHAGEPCLRCGRRLERVSFSGYELVYCPDCQTGGKVLADRRISRLLK